MHVRRYDGQEEHEAVEEEVFVRPADEQDCQGREENVETGDNETLEERDPHLDGWLLGLPIRLGSECRSGGTIVPGSL